MAEPNWKPPRTTKAQRRRASRERRTNHYGGADNWRALREEAFARDGYHCIAPGCEVDHLKTGALLEPAHLKSVGMGGRRVGSPYAINHVMWLATCCKTHARALDEAPNREQLRQAIKGLLSDKYGYQYETQTV